MTLFLIYMIRSCFGRHAELFLRRWISIMRICRFRLANVRGHQCGLLEVVVGVLAAELLRPFWTVPYLLAREWEMFSQQFLSVKSFILWL